MHEEYSSFEDDAIPDDADQHQGLDQRDVYPDAILPLRPDVEDQGCECTSETWNLTT